SIFQVLTEISGRGIPASPLQIGDEADAADGNRRRIGKGGGQLTDRLDAVFLDRLGLVGLLKPGLRANATPQAQCHDRSPEPQRSPAALTCILTAQTHRIPLAPKRCEHLPWSAWRPRATELWSWQSGGQDDRFGCWYCQEDFCYAIPAFWLL
ncbi:MAG TPA: hypothetical protein VFA18_22875, partial [Gemmataceae bacterium]|nr:hypothetical protein [Gemmataceae bacterium]